MKFKAISCIISMLLGFTGLGLSSNVDKSLGLNNQNATVNEAQVSEKDQEIKDSNEGEVPLTENESSLDNNVATENNSQPPKSAATEVTTETPNTVVAEKPNVEATADTAQQPAKVTPQTNTATTEPKNTTPTAAADTQGDYLAKVEDEIFTATNNERVKAGLQPFKRNSTANGYARSKSLDMLNLNYFDHKSPNSGYVSDIAKRDGWKYSRIGENIYTMTGSSASNASGTAINNSWMSSPGHKANILKQDFTDIGIGVTYRNNKLYATQIFYTP